MWSGMRAYTFHAGLAVADPHALRQADDSRWSMAGASGGAFNAADLPAIWPSPPKDARVRPCRRSIGAYIPGGVVSKAIIHG